MNDRALDMGLMIIFAFTGFMLLAAAWLVPDLQAERVAASIGGIVGIAFSFNRMSKLRGRLKHRARQAAPVKVRIRDGR